MTQNSPNFGTQNGKAKSQKARIAAQITRIVRRDLERKYHETMKEVEL